MLSADRDDTSAAPDFLIAIIALVIAIGAVALASGVEKIACAGSSRSIVSPKPADGGAMIA